tara:strand:+ start:480 stop:1124 length:645 start_codon:yes stop_codon:yes gene_type:complete
MPRGFPNLPNLGALDLRSCVVKTGTNSVSKRQKTGGAQDPEVAARGVEDFIDRRIQAYLGRTPTEQEKRDLIDRVRREVARMYAAQGLTDEWPDELGLTQGQALLEGKPADVRRLRQLKINLWGGGFRSLIQQQISARAEDDRKRKQAMLEKERKDKDSDDGRDYFDSVKPETPESPDALLKDEMRKKAEGNDPQRWGQDLENFDHDDGCCSQR